MMQILTTRSIAKKLGAPVWKVSYAISTCNIEPDAVAGHVRLFSVDRFPQIKRAVESVRPRSKSKGK